MKFTAAYEQEDNEQRSLRTQPILTTQIWQEHKGEMAKVNWECKQTKQRRRVLGSLSKPEVWKCPPWPGLLRPKTPCCCCRCCQCLHFQNQIYYRRIWISGFFGNMEGGSTGQQEYSSGIHSPEVMLSSLRSNNPLQSPSLTPRCMTGSRQDTQARRWRMSGEKTPSWRSTLLRGSGGGMSTLLDFVFPPQCLEGRENTENRGLYFQQNKM